MSNFASFFQICTFSIQIYTVLAHCLKLQTCIHTILSNNSNCISSILLQHDNANKQTIFFFGLLRQHQNIYIVPATTRRQEKRGNNRFCREWLCFNIFSYLYSHVNNFFCFNCFRFIKKCFFFFFLW